MRKSRSCWLQRRRGDGGGGCLCRTGVYGGAPGERRLGAENSGSCYLSALADVEMSFFTGQIYRIFVYSYSFSLDACKRVTYNGFIKFIGGWETERAAGDSRQRGKEGFL